MKVKLDPAGDKVTGPKGRIQFELGKLSLGNAGDHAVLLNGKTPAYFVGHVDEFNNNRIEKQELVVPPGTYQVTVTEAQQRGVGRSGYGSRKSASNSQRLEREATADRLEERNENVGWTSLSLPGRHG